MKKALKFIKTEMGKIQIDYHFMKNKKQKLSYPYFVSEIIPVAPINEDGGKEYTLIVDGFHRGSMLELMECTEQIEEHFPSVEGLCIMDGNETIVVYFSTVQPVDSGAEDLEKIQINLTIKTWKGG